MAVFSLKPALEESMGKHHPHVTRRAAGLLLLSGCLTPTIARVRETNRTMALTFDDLPYVARPFPETMDLAARVTKAILRTLAEFRAPALGLVNQARAERRGEAAAGSALLQSWVDAGATLGNHTYSHPDLNRVSVEDYEDDLLKGSVVIEQLMKPREPYQRYFRYPFNHTGPTQEVKQAVEAFLRAHQYRIAPHTVDSSDYIFNWGYVDSLRKGDVALSAKLRNAYIDFVIASTAFCEDIAPKIFGRNIPQVMLMHANDINADCLGDVLVRLGRRGYGFVTLDKAVADPAYQTPDTLVTTAGPDWLWRWKKSKGLDVSFKEQPDPPEWVTDLGNAVSQQPSDPNNMTRN